MYRIDQCPCCGGRELDAFPAGVAPFIAEYALEGHNVPTRLFRCGACAFRFFEHRFTEDEAARLYAGYRGDRYFQVRHKHEPWYTRAFNAQLSTTGGVAERRDATAALVRAHHAPIRSILDYGGDRGQFLPELAGVERFVFDISGVPAELGVTAFSRAAEVEGRTFDAVLASHLLEHVSDVSAVLRHIRALASPSDAMVIIEVPDEHFDLRWIGRGPAYAAHVRRVLSQQPFARLFDLYSAAFRVKLGLIPPLGFARVHEHINYFERRSLRTALRCHGFEVLRCDRVTSAGGSCWRAVATTVASAAPTP